MKLYVKVLDENGVELASITVPEFIAEDDAWDVNDKSYTPRVGRALAFAAPEFCPYDCDYCRDTLNG